MRPFMIRFMNRALLLTAAVTLLACSTAPAQQPTSPAPGDVAARIGDRAITVRDLDERWKQDDPAQNAEATQSIYDGRRAALEIIIAESLLAEAAKGSGLSADGYLEAEVAKRVKPVSDAEVVTFFSANSSQMQGRSLELMAPAINRYLTDQRRAQARDALIAELREGAGHPRGARSPAGQRGRWRRPISRRSRRAPVTLIEFSDYQCPYCQRVEPTLKRLRAVYGDKLRIVWKDFPLTQIHPQAFKAGEAAHCAGDQGKYWELHDGCSPNSRSSSRTI